MITDLRFFHQLEEWGDRPALRLEDGRVVGYRELAALADASWGDDPERVLAIVEMANALEPIVDYLGALRRGFPVILTFAGGAHELVRVFGPAKVGRFEDGVWAKHGGEERSDLHPDLAVMLSTSGSTGSAKLVRLAGTAIDANARSIGAYLEIRPEDRAITSLPLHYSYGLSVLNSHLACGASLAVTGRSVTDPEFRRFFVTSGSTSIAGVPHTYELLERVGFREDPPPALRTMTQAGGRLPVPLVQTYAAWSVERGVRFFPMYGQTEAAARIAYLPPELAFDNPDCIGVPIPGGSLRLDEGELVYAGPNVMMGYATERAHLALPAELDELRTGDLAELNPAGLFRITGRKSRFCKLFGLRIGLDDVERWLTARGTPGYASGDDELIAVALTGPADANGVRTDLADFLGIPQTVIAVRPGTEIPTLPSGKIDYRRLLADARAAREDASPTALADELAALLGYRELDRGKSFRQLGGDSLMYVHATLAIERRLGSLPRDWDDIPIGELDQHVPDNRARTAIPSQLVMRILAILLVIVGHAEPAGSEFLRGGALALFFLSGLSFVSFTNEVPPRRAWARFVRQTATNLLLPYVLVVIALSILSGQTATLLPFLTLTSVFFVDVRGPMFALWFIETLIHCQLVTLMIYTILHRSGIERVGRATAVVLAGLGLALLALNQAFGVEGMIELTLDGWLWAFALGFGAHLMRSEASKAVLILMAFAIPFAVFELGDGRALWLAVVVAVVLHAPSIDLPRRLATGVLLVSTASYFIYLSHVPLVHVVRFELGLSGVAAVIALIGASLVAGLIGNRVWRHGRAVLQKVFARRRKARR